jgi:hypothetical protein
MTKATAEILDKVWEALGGPYPLTAKISCDGVGELASVFPVSDLAAAAIGAAALAVAELIGSRAGEIPAVQVDRRLASMWFGMSLRPGGWSLPPVWDPIAGDYRAADGWIKLHTNAPHHRDAAIRVLGVRGDKEAVAAAVRGWEADRLEQAILQNGGCAAAMRSLGDWAAHPQGRAVASEPLFHRATMVPGPTPQWRIRADRPLDGVRVLDLTRVLAGPVATRFLAALGADVLRIDPPDWDEPGVVPEVTLGKRCARLDLRNGHDRTSFATLLADADVLVHGYRPGALGRLGFESVRMHELSPGLVEVSLDAYGWSGPWSTRRGFDSLVQMSTGIAAEGMRASGGDRPVPLPVQALDQATGYFLAAAAIRGLTQRLTSGNGCEVRASLARTARLLISQSRGDRDPVSFARETASDLADDEELTVWGPARRLKPPIEIQGCPIRWAIPAGPLGTAPPRWQGR